MKILNQPDVLEGFICLVEEADLKKPLDLPELKGDGWTSSTDAKGSS